MDSGIYRIRHADSGRCYIGSAQYLKARFQQHRRRLALGNHHSQFLQRAWNKYGAAAFVFEILLYCDKKDLIFYEQRCIDGFKPDYNMVKTAGSQLGYRHTDESKEKMSIAAKRTKNFKGHKHTEETKQRISVAKTGVKHGPYSAEHRAAISAAQKGKIISEETRAKISQTLTGRKQSPETIEKRAQKLRGRKMPEGFAAAASKRMTGRKLPESTIQKLREVECTDERRKKISDGLRGKPWSVARRAAAHKPRTGD